MNQESPSQELVPLKKRRARIPDKPNYSLNLWSIMKNCIGKELSKIPMPVSICCSKGLRLLFFLCGINTDVKVLTKQRYVMVLSLVNPVKISRVLSDSSLDKLN